MMGIETVFLISLTRDGSGMREILPRWNRSETTMQEAPADSAILAWSGLVTSMMPPFLSIWARPTLIENGF